MIYAKNVTGKPLFDPIIMKLEACNKLNIINTRNLACEAEYPTLEGERPKRKLEILGKYGRKVNVVRLRQNRPRMFDAGSTKTVPSA
jgi:hypothetical protein